MVKGFIFDYGGTLDTKAVHWATMIWQAYERQQVPVSYEHFWEAYVETERTLGREDIIQKGFTFRKTLETKIAMQLERLETVLAPRTSHLAPRLHSRLVTDLYERVAETTKESAVVLRELHHNYPIAIVSNFYGNLHVVLEEFELNGLVDSVIESAVVGIRKPNPAIFKMGVEALKMRPEEVMVVGDSLEKDILPACEVGCQTAWYEGRGSGVERRVERGEGFVIHDLRELLEIISFDYNKTNREALY